VWRDHIDLTTLSQSLASFSWGNHHP